MNKKLAERADYLLSREKGTIYKDPGGKLKIVLVYPNIYSVGMSSLGFQGIYGLLNGFSDVVCERVFLPAEDEIEEYERTGSELFSLESRRPLSRFDIVAFSVSFENDYPNILKILRMARIPARSSGRSQAHPVIVMGGVCSFSNPEPLAEFMDIVLVGEAEEMVPEFLSAFRNSSTKDELFNKCLKIDGLYVPKYYSVNYAHDTGLILGRQVIDDAPEFIRKRTIKDISRSSFRPVITTPEAEFADMYLLEAMRGCPWSCRFCLAGHLYNPPRKKDLETVRAEITDAKKKTGRVGLIGPSLTDYPHAEDVMSIEGVDFSITSLRASERSGRISALMKRHRSVSIAPEAGTQRLRDVIGKKITDEDILDTAKLILDGETETLRLYFMVGLPTETRLDVEGIIDLVGKIRAISRRGLLALSVSTFVPKPFTPFQWHSMEPIKEVKERLKMIKKGLSTTKGVRVFHDVPKYAYLQGVLSRGDRRVSELIERLATGQRFSLGGAESREEYGFYIFRKRDASENLPWDFIDAGMAKEKLWKEYRKAVDTTS
ncbi:MAG: radical SAM protein [Candidatus Sulfobium sp.]